MALVYLATAHLRIPSPDFTGAGQVHVGTAVVFVISVAFGPKMGAISTLGMVLFNLTWGLPLWAPINLVARPIMAWIFGSIAHSADAAGRRIWRNILAAIAGGLWLVAAMYVGQVLMFGVPWAVPLMFVPNNAMQIALALLLGLPMIRIVQRYKLSS